MFIVNCCARSFCLPSYFMNYAFKCCMLLSEWNMIWEQQCTRCIKCRQLLFNLSNTSSFFREFEPVRLLGLQLFGKLLAGVTSEKKGTKLFSLPLVQSRCISDNLMKEITASPQLFFCTISERLFKFPLSDNLCAALFSFLCGTTPQQVIVPTSCHIAVYL
jgi:hypothetical protein